MKTARLGDIASINPRDDSVPAGENVSFVGMAQLDAEQALARPLETRSFAEVSRGYTIFRDGDLLAAKITPCWQNGKIGQARLENKVGVGSTEFHVIRPDSELDERYLLHFLRQSTILTTGELRMTGSGGQRRVPAAFLNNLQIPVPSIDKQRRIAGILDLTGATRTKRRRVLKHLDTLTQSIFHYMFDEHVEMVEFGDVIESGPTNGLYRPLSDYGTGTPILRIDGFDEGRIKNARWKRVSLSDSDRERYTLTVGDLVINRVNALSHLGKSAIVESLDEPSVYESNIMRVRLDLAKVVPNFVVTWLQTSAVKQQILSMAKKAINQASINQRDVKSLLMPYPPIEPQRDFAARLNQINAQRAVVQRALEADNELFASLQSRAFKGEL